MRSSSPRPELYRLLLHPAISVVVPATGMLAALYLVAGLIGSDGPRALTVIGVALAPLVEAAVGNVLYRERAGMGNRVRELIIYLLLLYVAFSLARGGPLAARFVPDAAQLLPLVAAAVTWCNAFVIHNRLRGREGLLRTFHGKRGDELRRALIDRQHDMALTVRELRLARGGIAAVFLLLSVMAVLTATGVVTGSTLPVGSPGFLLLVVNGVAGVLGIGAINSFIEEYAANGEGLRVPTRFHRRRFVTAAAVVLVVVGASFALSRSSGLLPLDAIAAFFRWIGSLFDRKRAMAPPELVPQTTSADRYRELMELLQGSEPVIPPLWLRLLAELLRRLAIALAAAAASILLFGPLLSPAFRQGLRQIRPGRIIRSAWQRLVRKLRILARWLRTRALPGGRRRGAGNAPAGVQARPERRWRPSAAKRRQMDRVTSVFASITRWGAAHGLGYRESEAAYEYLSRVAGLYAEHFADVQVCREVFWTARYSRRMVALRQMREYVRAARRITGSG